jgi:trigger factor
MKATLDKTENHMTYLTVETEASEIEEYIEKVYQRIVKGTEVPGFRKGNAPREVLEKYVGREKMMEDAIKEMVPVTCSKVLKEQNLEAVIQPMVKILRNEPLKFEMVVPLKPVVELGDYHGIKVEPDSLEVKEEEVDKVLEDLRNQFGGQTMVDRPVKEGDIITLDIEGVVYESPFLRKKGVKFQVTPDFATDIPDLYEKMIGAKKGEELKFKLRLPENYESKVVAGKEVDFTVLVHDIQETSLPELDDEFAKKVAPGIESIDVLKERIRANMKSEKEHNADSKFEEKIVEALIESSKLEYPPIMVDLELRGLIEEYKQRLQSSCKDQKEYEQKIKQVPEEKLREEGGPVAKKRILWSLVLNEVTKAEGIDVNDQEIDAEIESMIKDSGAQMEEMRGYMNNYENRMDVKSFLLDRKTIKRLVEIVKASNN